jgi:hypothetical protein
MKLYKNGETMYVLLGDRIFLYSLITLGRYRKIFGYNANEIKLPILVDEAI